MREHGITKKKLDILKKLDTTLSALNIWYL